MIVAQSDAAAHLRSHAGPGASEVLCVERLSVAFEFEVEPQLFSTVFERFSFPLEVTDASCECGLDLLGRHRATCPRSGCVRSRALGTKWKLCVCREAGTMGHECSLQSFLTLGRTQRRSTAISSPTKAVWWLLPSRPVASAAVSSSALAWIRFPILVRIVDQDVVSVLRKGFCDFVGFFSGRTLDGQNGFTPDLVELFST